MSMAHDNEVAQPPADTKDAGLPIGDLAQRTGLSPAVLRMWESRYGFPEPRRLASGHRRYTDAEVDLVRQVVRRRDSGIRLVPSSTRRQATRRSLPTWFGVGAPLRQRLSAIGQRGAKPQPGVRSSGWGGSPRSRMRRPRRLGSAGKCAERSDWV